MGPEGLVEEEKGTLFWALTLARKLSQGGQEWPPASPGDEALGRQAPRPGEAGGKWREDSRGAMREASTGRTTRRQPRRREQASTWDWMGCLQAFRRPLAWLSAGCPGSSQGWGPETGREEAGKEQPTAGRGLMEGDLEQATPSSLMSQRKGKRTRR